MYDRLAAVQEISEKLDDAHSFAQKVYEDTTTKLGTIEDSATSFYGKNEALLLKVEENVSSVVKSLKNDIFSLLDNHSETLAQFLTNSLDLENDVSVQIEEILDKVNSLVGKNDGKKDETRSEAKNIKEKSSLLSASINITNITNNVENQLNNTKNNFRPDSVLTSDELDPLIPKEETEKETNENEEDPLTQKGNEENEESDLANFDSENLVANNSITDTTNDTNLTKTDISNNIPLNGNLLNQSNKMNINEDISKLNPVKSDAFDVVGLKQSDNDDINKNNKNENKNNIQFNKVDDNENK